MAKIVKSAQDRQWEIDDAVRVLQRAEAIKNDKFLMGGVKKSIASLNKVVAPMTKSAPKKGMKKK